MIAIELWTRICLHIAREHYADLLSLSLVSRTFHQIATSEPVWYTAFRSVFVHCRLGYNQLQPRSWRRLFVRYAAIRIKWQQRRRSNALEWTTVVHGNEATGFPYANIAAQVTVVQTTAAVDTRRIVAFTADLDDGETLLAAVDAASSAAIAHIILLNAEHSQTNIFCLQTSMVMGALLHEEHPHIMVGLWMQQASRYESMSLYAVTNGELDQLAGFALYFYEGTYYLFGFTPYPYHLIKVTFQLDGWTPVLQRITQVGSRPVEMYWYFKELSDMFVLVAEGNNVFEVWSIYCDEPVAQLDVAGLDLNEVDLNHVNLDGDLWSCENGHSFQGRPRTLLMQCAGQIYLWECESVTRPVGLIYPSAVFREGCVSDTIKDFELYQGILVYTDASEETLVMDVSGAGPAVYDASSARWHLQPSEDMLALAELCTFGGSCNLTDWNRIANHIYTFGSTQIQQLELPTV